MFWYSNVLFIWADQGPFISFKMSQSNSFTGNDLMVSFNEGWSCLINKLSLICNLDLFASEGKSFSQGYFYKGITHPIAFLNTTFRVTANFQNSY